MAKIEKVELRMVDLVPKVQAHRRHPELRQPGDADRHHHRRRRRRRGPATAIRSAPAARRSCGCSPIIWRRASSAATPTRSRRSGTSSNSPPMRRRSAPSRRSRSPRSTRRSGICARRSRACRCGSWPAAPRIAARSTPPKAAGCISRQQALVDDALHAKAKGFRGSKVKIGRPHGSEDFARLSAVRKAVGDGYEIMTDCNQGFTVDEAIRRAERLRELDLAWIEEPLPADDIDGHVRLVAVDRDADRRRRVALLDPAFPRIHAEGRLLDRAGRCRPHRRHHALAEGGACGGGVRHAGLPAFPDGAACQPRLRRAERPLCRVHSAARRR